MQGGTHMNPKRVVGITLTVIILLLLAAGARLAQTGKVAAEAPRVPQVQATTLQRAAVPARPLHSPPWPRLWRRCPAQT